jgi:hypothetical protein
MLKEILLYLTLYMSSVLHQLYKTKLRLAGLAIAVAGIGLIFLGKAIPSTRAVNWMASWPLNEIGTTLLSAGVIAIVFEYYSRKESEAIAAEHVRSAIRQEAPAIRDAVLDSLAFNADALRDVASPAMLDRIAANALTLRLGDQALAHEVYADVRDQVIRANERWHDVDLSVTLSPWGSGPRSGRGSMFVATIRSEYRVEPASATMRFACVSDPAEYRELLRDRATTSVWHFENVAGVDAADAATFELLQVTVDGKPRKIRRTARAGAQLYSANLGSSAAAGREITLAYTYRVLVQRHGHLLYLDLPQPARGLHVRFDYQATDIRFVNPLDYFASTEQARVDRSPSGAPAKTVDVSFDGWIFPRSGVAFVWVLEEELEQSTP